MLHVEVIATEELGDRSYVAHDGNTAVVVDPQRDLDRVERLLADRGLAVGAVLETHVHNDYVTGGYELARRTGARYVLHQADDVAFDRHGVTDGDELTVGGLTVRVLATPGHTDHHVSYVVSADGGQPGTFEGHKRLWNAIRPALVALDPTYEGDEAAFCDAYQRSAYAPDLLDPWSKGASRR